MIVSRMATFASALLLVTGLAACRSDSESPTPTTAPAATATATAVVAVNKEVENVKSLVPFIDRIVAALKSGDVSTSRQAYDAFDARWNGIEVYINIRSRPTYEALELDLQAKIAKSLEAPQPVLADILPNAELYATKYKDAIAISEKGPALSPLVDDLTTLRIVRADLRIVTASLTANDLPKAKTYFASFKKSFPSVENLIKIRSIDAHRETADALARVDASFQANAAVDPMKPLVAALSERYNYAVRLLNLAARNADLTKQTFLEDDKKSLTSLNDIDNQLRASLASWETANYTASSASASAAQASFAQVQPALASKANDTDLKNTTTAYAALAGAAGDAAKVRAANKTALESVAAAQQVLIGQFWTHPALQSFISSLKRANTVSQ
ncbi:MAG: hypothetical protein EXR59_04040 [Dehalococcoidia bacterium]|nr:hypothetical protein [Dehalococcoidia bacterium]